MDCRIPGVKLADPIRRSNYSATLLALFAVTPLAFAQNAAPIASATTSAKPLAFEVVSIRPAQPGAYATVSSEITPEGYSVPSQPLIYTILMAYFPQGFAYWSNARFSGAPHWLSDQYEIDAKVSEADLAEWHKQGKTLDKEPMLRQMLQTMLADRCHFVAHMVPGPPITGFSLELGKRAPRITESKPGETLPVSGEQPDGGVAIPLTEGGVAVSYHREGKSQVSFHGATMADLAEFVSVQDSGHPVLDHTGLTGHYDFVLNLVDDAESKAADGTVSSANPDPLSDWETDINALGLHLVPVKIPADTLVIDHIERPSEN